MHIFNQKSPISPRAGDLIFANRVKLKDLQGGEMHFETKAPHEYMSILLGGSTAKRLFSLQDLERMMIDAGLFRINTVAQVHGKEVVEEVIAKILIQKAKGLKAAEGIHE